MGHEIRRLAAELRVVLPLQAAQVEVAADFDVLGGGSRRQHEFCGSLHGDDGRGRGGERRRGWWGCPLHHGLQGGSHVEQVHLISFCT